MTSDNHLELSFSLLLTSKLALSQKRSLLQNSIYNYKEIELNFRQISELQKFL